MDIDELINGIVNETQKHVMRFQSVKLEGVLSLGQCFILDFNRHSGCS